MCSSLSAAKANFFMHFSANYWMNVLDAPPPGQMPAFLTARFANKPEKHIFAAL
jgi:hypothetical protein